MTNVKLNTTSGIVQHFDSITSLVEHYREHADLYDFRISAAGELCLIHKGHRTIVGVIVEPNGHVMHGETVIVLTRNAYADNYGTDGAVRYYASGIDAAGNKYTIAWDTTAAWDQAGEDYKASDYQDMPSIFDDESNACDWDSPVEITAL